MPGPRLLPVQGRAWLRLGQRVTLRFEWHLWSRFAHAGLRVEPGEGEICLGVALPPVALWWAVEGVRSLFKAQPREIGWRFHGWTLFWYGWTDPNVRCSGTPWWRYFSLDVLSTLFGRVAYRVTELESEVVAVPMPEGPYAGRAALEEHSWKRSRLPFAIRKQFVRIVTVHGRS